MKKASRRRGNQRWRDRETKASVPTVVDVRLRHREWRWKPKVTVADYRRGLYVHEADGHRRGGFRWRRGAGRGARRTVTLATISGT